MVSSISTRFFLVPRSYTEEHSCCLCWGRERERRPWITTSTQWGLYHSFLRWKRGRADVTWKTWRQHRPVKWSGTVRLSDQASRVFTQALYAATLWEALCAWHGCTVKKKILTGQWKKLCNIHVTEYYVVTKM